MLIARAPVRVSFFGGGTDLPAYYLQYGGSVLSTTINKYVYVIMNVSEQNVLQITSSDYQTFYRHTPGEPLLWDGDLSLPRAVLHHFGVEHGVSLFLASEVPPGTGLGSSSSVMVALIKAVSAARGMKLSKAQVAEMAVQIELEKMGNPIGVQDQYAAAFGGLNCFTFDSAGIHAEPIDLPATTLKQLESNLLLIFTGSARDSAEILSRQTQASQQRDPIVIKALQAVHELSRRARDYLVNSEVDQFGALLHEAWQHKKRFAAGVTNARIDQVYELALRHGALGGKITGAGGGGFLMLYCPADTIERVAGALADEGLRRMEFRFEQDGARVLFNAGLRL